MENVGIFYGHWNILRPFGNVVVIWYMFPHFGILCQEKSGNPGQTSGHTDFVLQQCLLWSGINQLSM
jgi:hypothetical protein